MANSKPGRCSYEYEAPPTTTPPDSSVDIPRPNHQRCPHATADADDERCLFHHLDADYPVDRISEQFLEALAAGDGPPTFAGGQLSGLRLDGATLTTPNGEPIDLRGATIDGDFDLSEATIDVPLLLDGAAITGSFIATDATFNAPISLVGTDIGRRVFLQRAHIDGGLVANELDAGYLDTRELTVKGSTILSDANFTANVILARSTFGDALNLQNTSFDYNIDVSGTEVDGPLILSGIDCEGDADLVAGRVAGDLAGIEMNITGDTDWRHLQVGGGLELSQSTFEGDAEFDDISIEGAAADFSEANFKGETSFSTAQFETAETRFTDALFDGDTWFTYATISGDATFESATFHEFVHLRDATFERNLSLVEAETTHQAFLHGSTIHGDFTAANATFNHFQFSATVHGDADFEGARFDEGGIFSNSEFGGTTTFDHASFAGGPDFSDARFTGPTSFHETEFLVEPTFDETRFAIEPDLEAARYPTPASRNLDDLRKSMILARPETLQHAGFEIETTALTDEIVIPAKTSPLVEDDLARTMAVTAALSDLDHADWYDLFEDGLRTARTAVAQLDPNDGAILVFGITVEPEAEEPTAFIQDATIAGVYARRDATVEFGYLHTDVGDFDYLIPVPADDDAFEAGASVAVLGELATAMVRQQAFRTALLQRRDEEMHMNRAILPVLVAAAETADDTINEQV